MLSRSGKKVFPMAQLQSNTLSWRSFGSYSCDELPNVPFYSMSQTIASKAFEMLPHAQEAVRQALRNKNDRLTHFFSSCPSATSCASSWGPFNSAQRIAVMDGSFNPPTLVHGQMGLRAVSQLRSDHVLLLLSCSNADKRLTGASLEQRLCLLAALAMEMYSTATISFTIALTNAPLFSEKAHVLRQHIATFSQNKELLFLLGADTLLRLIDIKYYGTTFNRDDALRLFFGKNLPVTISLACFSRPRFMVTGSPGVESCELTRVMESDELLEYSDQVHFVPEMFGKYSPDEAAEVTVARDIWAGKFPNMNFSSSQARADFSEKGSSVVVLPSVQLLIRKFNLYNRAPLIATEHL
jgi:nicotinic acid mononucleotide adenylyltransferase